MRKKSLKIPKTKYTENKDADERAGREMVHK